jgi:hypothetical protein
MNKEIFQSLFILNKVKTTSWENRLYINHLTLLLRLMKKSRLSPAEGQHFFLLRKKYETEYLELLKEMDPGKYRIALEERELLLLQAQKDVETDAQKIARQINIELAEYNQWMAIQQTAN